MTTDSFALDWSAIVALGTLGLAAGTFYLGWTTRNLARAASADMRAQWRPVIVPVGGAHGLPPSFDESSQRFIVHLKNAGRGPALFIRTTLDPHGASPDLWNTGSLASDEEVRLAFAVPKEQLGALMQVLMDYRDLSGRTYSSAVVIHTVERNGVPSWAYYDVKLFEEYLTHHGDSVPQFSLTPLPDANEPE